MTQFKFGDRVQDADGKQFVFLRGYLSCCTVASSDGETHDYLLDKIYPCATRPHPDTVRLDWLEKNRAILYHNIAEDIKHGCAPIEVGCWHGEKPHGGCTVREAIDTAMREKAA